MNPDDKPKTCPRCDRDLHWRDFYKRPNGKPRGYCKLCDATAVTAHRRAHGVKPAATPQNRRPAPPAGMKWCYICKAHHPIADFANDRSQNDGHDEVCRIARKQRQAEYRRLHPEQERNRNTSRNRLVGHRQRVGRDRTIYHAPAPDPTWPPQRGTIVKYGIHQYRVLAVKDDYLQLSNGAIITMDEIATA